MTHYIKITLLLLITSLHTQAQTQILWQKCYGNGGTNYIGKPIKTKDGNMLMTYEQAPNLPQKLQKIDKNSGNILWSKNIRTDTRIGDMIELPDGTVIGVGATSNPAVPNNIGSAQAVYVVKMDSAGNTIWENCMATNWPDHAEFVAYLDGRVLVGGKMRNDDATFYFYYTAIIEFNASTGAFIKQNWLTPWAQDTNLELVKMFKSTDPTKYYIQDKYAGLIRIDTSLNINSLKRVLPVNTYGYTVMKRAMYNRDSSRFVTIGFVYDSSICSSTGSFDQMRRSVNTIDTANTVRYHTGCVASQYASFVDMMESDDGNYYAGGLLENDAQRNVYDYWLIKFSDQGVIFWEQTFGGTNDDRYSGMCKGANPGEIVLYGHTNSNNGQVSCSNGTGGWVIKLKDMTMVSVAEGKAAQNNWQISPADAANSHTITLLGDGIKYPVNINLVDMLGNKVANYAMQSPTLTIDLSPQAQGVYLLQAAGYKSSKLVR